MTTATAPAKRKTRPTKTVESILAGRGGNRTIGQHFKLAPGSLGIDILAEPRIDTSKVMATCVISTPTVDRVGDLLIPMGCVTKNYAKNPAVLWNHGFGGIDLPIGRAADESGVLAVRVDQSGVESDCYFAQSLPSAMQIFELVAEKVIKAASVRETPIVSSYQRDRDIGDILLVEEWELEEWSWVPVGCNPDAVAKVLHRNKLADRPIAEPIFKSLMAVAPELKRFGKGAKFTAETKAVTKTNTKSADETPADEEAEVVPGEDESAKNSPYGSQLLSAMHTHLAATLSWIKESMGPLENPDVKAALTAIEESMTEHLTAVEGCYGKCYPDGQKLAGDAADADTESAMKSWLAAGLLPGLQIDGLGSRLKQVATAGNLTDQQRGVIQGVCKHFARLQEQAKAKASTKTAKDAVASTVTTPPADDPVVLAANETKIKALEAKLSALSSKP